MKSAPIFLAEIVVGFVGLRGLDPGSELISQISPYTTSPFGNCPWSTD